MTGRGLWGSMVGLNQAVQQAVLAASSPPSPDAIDSALRRVELAHQMNIALQRHRTTFITLLHKPKSQADRDTLQRSVTEAVALPGFSSPAKLPESMVREALLVADMYALNEMAALSLIKSAQEEKTLYPGMPRGLIAVLFYYDSKEQFSSAFKTLIQARQGISWTLLEGNEELSVSISRYLKPMLNLNMLDKILEMISSMDLVKEVELLQQNRALGDSRHRRMVLDKFKSVRSLLAEAVFCWAAQTPLEKEECRRLMAYLARVKLSDTADGSLDTVTITLTMSLLYSLEAGHLLAVEDMTDALSSFPITSDKTFVADIHRELKSGRDWECSGLKAVVQLAWAVSLANLRQVTNNIQLTDYDSYIDEDEAMLDEALRGNAFTFIEKSMLSNSNLPLDQFHCRRLHSIFADLIHRMPERIKHMKTKADENAQNILAYLREGLQVPVNMEQPFEQLLTCMSALYTSSPCQELLDEFWCESASSNSLNSRQVALKNFVLLPRDFLPHSLFIPYVKFLSSLASNERAAQRIYDFLRFGRPGSQESNLSWEHFLGALSKYYQNLRLEQPAVESIYRSSRGARAITPQELEGLVAVLELVAVVVKHDETARVDLSSRVSNSPIELCAGLLTCCVPLSLKTQLVQVLAAFSVSPAVAVTVWQSIEAAGIVPAVDGAPGYTNRGIKQDIEEVESSSEEFPLSRAIVSLFISLVSSGIPGQISNSMRGHGFGPYLRLVQQQIFLPHDSRTYRRSEEKWQVARTCCTLFHKLVQQYQPAPNKGTSASHQPAHSIVLDLVHDSKLLRQLLSVFHDGVSLLEQHIDSSGLKDVQITLKLILEMFLKVLKLQRLILNSEENGTLLLIGLDKLLMSMNPRSGNCDHLVNVTRLIGHHATLPQHSTLACDLLTIVGGSPSGHKHLMPLLTAPNNATATRQFVVQLIDHATLDVDHSEAAKAALNLFKTFLTLPGPNLSHFFLGFMDGTGVRNGELRSDLLEPGVRGFPRTAMHAILSVLPTLPPCLSEIAHSLLHSLASHHSTADATLRYLSSRDFVYRSLGALPIATEETPDRILATSWILKIAALDLRYHSAHQQRSQLNRFITLLVSGSETNMDANSDNLDTNFNWMGSNNTGSSRGVLLALLEVLELNVDPPAPLQCQYLTRASEIIKTCEEGSHSDVNIERLYQLLQQGVQDSNPTTGGPLEAEVQQVLDHALARNVASCLLRARKNLMESWGQLTEVSVTVTPSDMLQGPVHRAFLHAITLELSRRVLDDMARPDLTSLLGSTLLILVSTLANVYEGVEPGATTTYVASLDGGGGESVPGSLLLILRGLVEGVTRFRHSHQSVRANVYAALLHFFTIHSSCVGSEDAPSSLVVATGESSVEQYQRESYEVVKEELQGVLSVLCCEATAGHHLCRMLSLSCLSAIAALERRATIGSTSLLTGNCTSALLDQLTQQGQLRRLLDGMEQDDSSLAGLVSSGGDLRPLYVWQARCALIAQLAMTPDGARQLLQSGLMGRLSKIQVLSCGLEVGGGITLDVVKCAMRICDAVVSSLGSEDWSAGSQIADFLTSHMCTMNGLLQPPSAAVPIDTFALVAGVVANTAAAGQTNAAILMLHQHLTALLPHLLPPHANTGPEGGHFQRLSSISRCLNCCSHHVLTNPLSVTFQPSLDTSNPRALTLGTLLQALKFAINTFNEVPANSNSPNVSATQQVCSHIAECGEFLLWRHLHTFLSSSNSSASHTPQPLLQAGTTTSLVLHTPSLSAAVTQPQSSTLSPVQAAALKEQMGEAYNEVYTALNNLHQQYSSKVSHVAFLPAISQRIRKLLVT